MTNDPATYRLGRLPARHDPRTLRAATYLDLAQLPPAPPSWQATTPRSAWGMYANDRLGDCTCAALAHQRMVFSASIGGNKTPSEKAIVDLYYRIGAQENPGQSHPDNGLVELDVLRYWWKHQVDYEDILAFAAVDPHNHEHVKQAAVLFEGLYIGFSISDPAQLFREFDAQTPWTPEAGQDTEGHAVDLIGYDDETVTVVSWGRKQTGTWAWWDQKVDEAWAIVPQEYKAHPPTGFKLAQLEADLAALGNVTS